MARPELDKNKSELRSDDDLGIWLADGVANKEMLCHATYSLLLCHTVYNVYI